MRFNTHNRTPKIDTHRSVKVILVIGYCLIVALFLFLAITCSLFANSIMPAVVILLPVLLIVTLLVITQKDMDRSFVEIVDDVITVTDYCLGFKNIKTFSMDDIASAEVCMGYSPRIHGLRYNHAGNSYIVFKNRNNKYMFKIIFVPETKLYFRQFFKT